MSWGWISLYTPISRILRAMTVFSVLPRSKMTIISCFIPFSPSFDYSGMTRQREASVAFLCSISVLCFGRHCKTNLFWKNFRKIKKRKSPQKMLRLENPFAGIVYVTWPVIEARCIVSYQNRESGQKWYWEIPARIQSLYLCQKPWQAWSTAWS